MSSSFGRSWRGILQTPQKLNAELSCPGSILYQRACGAFTLAFTLGRSGGGLADVLPMVLVFVSSFAMAPINMLAMGQAYLRTFPLP